MTSNVATALVWGATALVWGATAPHKILFCLPKTIYLVVTSEFLLHFRPNWHQNNNKLG